MKNIVIISPDTVPLKLKEVAPRYIVENGVEYSIQDKCTRATVDGIRAWKMAEELSKEKDFRVNLYVPNLNYPGKEYIDDTGLSFNIIPYNFKAALWNWSEELDRRLKGMDFVIVQSTVGAGFQNCAVLPGSVNVIVDGFVPFFAELPCTLLGSSRIYRKIFWNRFFYQYTDLIRRANCVLYVNERQYHYYEGQFFAMGKLDWSSYQFSPLLKVPFGVDTIPRIEKRNTDAALKLLWYGPVYPWYNPEALLSASNDFKNVQIDFTAIVHPRYRKIYNNYFKKYFDEAEDYPNINIKEEYCDNRADIYSEYDAGIILSRDWIEENYSHRTRVLDMLSHGLPVFLNKGNVLFNELNFINDGLYPISADSIANDLNKIKKEDITLSEESLDSIRNRLSWNTSLSPLTDYIKKF